MEASEVHNAGTGWGVPSYPGEIPACLLLDQAAGTEGHNKQSLCQLLYTQKRNSKRSERNKGKIP